MYFQLLISNAFDFNFEFLTEYYATVSPYAG